MPAFFINGRMVSGAQAVNAFIRIIEDALAFGSLTTVRNPTAQR